MATQAKTQKNLVFSKIGLPAEELLIPIIKQGYANIGYDVHFVDTTVERRIDAVDAGVIDGDLMRVRDVNSKLANTFKVNVPLLEVELLLTCAAEVNCDENAFFDPQAFIAMDKGVLTIIENHLQQKITANIAIINHIDATFELFEKKRVDYVINLKYLNPTLNKTISVAPQRAHQSIGITPMVYYHYLNTKHLPIQQQIEASLNELLPQLKSLKKKPDNQ